MSQPTTGQPRPSLSLFDAVAMIVGLVIGIGIFTFPALVASNAASASDVLLLWLAGGAISLIGALCYAELATAFPSAGGEYHFLSRAFGPQIAFLFAWARLGVIQTGAIALVCFILGDYATRLYDLGPNSSAIYAGITIVILTIANLLGAQPGKNLQNVLACGIVGLLALAIVVGLINGIPGAPAVAPPAASAARVATAPGVAMIFILLTYGGWNEAAYLSAEVKDASRNMVRVLMLSLVLITIIYVLVNVAYLHVLGLEGMRGSSTTIGAELMNREFGSAGAALLSIAVIFAALSTANATIFTGARTSYALGRDFQPLGFLGKWSARGAPASALIIQGAIALGLVVAGAFTLDGVKAMVNYVTPVFWFFMLLVALSLFVLRVHEPNAPRPFRVPLYPVTPFIFVLTCTYMLHSGIDFARSTFAGVLSLAGVLIVLAGVPLLLWANPKRT
jgi:APA family basic amino acid/polyamine antiporter